MKRIFLAIGLLFGGAIFSLGFAQVTENFNTRATASSPSEIKFYLQDRCWMLLGMDVTLSAKGKLEQDGKLLSSLFAGEHSGLYTPMLQLSGDLTVSFNYSFSGKLTSGHKLNIYLTDYDNVVEMELATIDLTNKNGGVNYKYENKFTNIPAGGHRLFINFVDPDGTNQIALDEFSTDAPRLYDGGCKQSPVAVIDFISGAEDRTAKGNLLQNDYDPDGEQYTVYLVNNSHDGDVVLNEDGSFSFTPRPNFQGTTTNFTYQICAKGLSPICSNVATVTIRFPGATMPMQLVDFSAAINNEHDVNLNWATSFEEGTDRFDIERSLDGTNFKKIGEVKSLGNKQARNDYGFDDRLRSSTLNNNDVYYRLRLVNGHNQSDLSKVLVIRLFNTPNTKTVAVTPNPAKNDINVQVLLRENSYVVMKVTNSKGDEVSRKSIKGASGMNSYMLEGTSKLTPGVYMLEVIINSSERMLTKLVKN
jgi:hypothetical protein